MKLERLTVLGGSTPFTAALIDALLAEAESLEPYHLVLHGRNEKTLGLIHQYAEAQLARWDWTIESSTSIQAAIEGAAIVVHQIRYGGLELRKIGEDICSELNVISDETFGVSALLTALLTTEQVERTARLIQQQSPNTLVLNLTNPLSAVTRKMGDAGPNLTCIGLCELPRFTMQKATELLGVAYHETDWAYFGLNHRGFIHRASHNGVDLIPLLANALGQDEFLGVSSETINTLNAIPLKYFRLVANENEHPPSRASTLMSLRSRIAAELTQSCQISPPSLGLRYTEWYPLSLVPLLGAFQSDRPQKHVVSIHDDRSVVYERQVMVSKRGIDVVEPGDIPVATSRWLEVFVQHERAFLEATAAPSLSKIEQVLRLDPTMSPSTVRSAAQRVWKEFEKLAKQESMNA